jgi:hypothetical protein
VESRTTGGGRLLVAVEWSVCILEGLELPTSLTEEEQQTMCACLMTHNTLYLFNLEYKEIGLYYHVEASCNGMACPPYNAEKELGCVVCSK